MNFTNQHRMTLVAGIAAMVFAAPVDARQGRGIDRTAGILAQVACRSVQRFRDCRLEGTKIDQPADGIERTRYHIRVGAGEFDTITVHHVETDRNTRLPRALMLLPGTGLDVENLYLPALNIEKPVVPDDYSPLIDFARAGIDAWSMDYRGSELPAEIEDFSFMAEWGLNTAATDAQLALRFARLVRLFHGDGYRRIHIGGYSAGVSVAFSVASLDAARHYGRRDVRGIVAVDDAFDIDPAMSVDACDQFEFLDTLLSQGIFHEDLRFFPLIGGLAKTDPGGTTPVGPPVFTNLEFFNLVVTQPFAPDSTFHIFGGGLKPGFPPPPAYTTQAFAIEQALMFEPSIPLQFGRELAEIRCSAEPVSALDGGLPGVTVPVLHIGAAGGNANAIDYTLGQIGSTDITSMLVQALGPGQEVSDYGHGDVFAATDADVRVWQPIIDWVKAH